MAMSSSPTQHSTDLSPDSVCNYYAKMQMSLKMCEQLKKTCFRKTKTQRTAI